MKPHFLRLAFLVLALTLPVRADETVDEQMIARFKVAGFQHSVDYTDGAAARTGLVLSDAVGFSKGFPCAVSTR